MANPPTGDPELPESSRRSDTGEFFQPGADPPAKIQLEQTGPANFKMLSQLGYQDSHFAEPFIVPPDVGTFRTDLTSVPSFFQWLVPSIGVHLSAALIHDGLIYAPNEGKTYIGPDVSREQADRIFRDGMRDLGTPLIRRWVIWTAVTVATVLSAPEHKVRWRATVFLTVGIVIALGVMATLNLFNVWHGVPWMGRRSLVAQVALGALFAAITPIVLSTLWGHLWRAGLILGWALAFLIHVTAAVAIVFAIYLVLESIASLFDHRGPSIKDNLGVVDKEDAYASN
jgi:uncharacterized protein DUF1353